MRVPSSLALALTFGSVVIAGAFPNNQVLAQSQTHGIAGSIHGLVLAEALESRAPIDIAMPHADVKVRNASGLVVGETSTSLAGIFASPLLPAGAYRVCASAVGFTEVCASESTTLTNASAALHQPLVLTAQGGTLHGRVTLKDGSPAVRLAVAAGSTAAAAQVSLADAVRPRASGPRQRQHSRRLRSRARRSRIESDDHRQI
jgi:hypothetical protein